MNPLVQYLGGKWHSYFQNKTCTLYDGVCTVVIPGQREFDASKPFRRCQEIAGGVRKLQTRIPEASSIVKINCVKGYTVKPYRMVSSFLDTLFTRPLFPPPVQVRPRIFAVLYLCEVLLVKTTSIYIRIRFQFSLYSHFTALRLRENCFCNKKNVNFAVSSPTGAQILFHCTSVVFCSLLVRVSAQSKLLHVYIRQKRCFS